MCVYINYKKITKLLMFLYFSIYIYIYIKTTNVPLDGNFYLLSFLEKKKTTTYFDNSTFFLREGEEKSFSKLIVLISLIKLILFRIKKNLCNNLLYIIYW